MITSPNTTTYKDIQRPPAESLYADELKQLAKEDQDQNQFKPAGWLLSPQAVIKFVLGDITNNIEPKFVGSKQFLERCVVTLATNRSLILIGEPGTAKSYLSELLSAAISGISTLMIQGSAGITEDNIKYSWNYAYLLSEGPDEKALVPAPIYRGFTQGKIVRFEEITRCPLEIQDSLLSILSDRVMSIPELPEKQNIIFARNGFNIIATANTHDKGVNDMSVALKRRFNFETVNPIHDIEQEIELVIRETNKLFSFHQISAQLEKNIATILVTAFQDLRRGYTADNRPVEQPDTTMSTADAISVSYSAGIQAHYFNQGIIKLQHLLNAISGTIIKDTPEDKKVLQNYFRYKGATETNPLWQELPSLSNEVFDSPT